MFEAGALFPSGGFRRRLAAAAALLTLAVAAGAADTLSLSQVLQEALSKNPGYLAARADLRFAEQAHSSAGLAGYLPTAAANGGYAWSNLDTRVTQANGAVSRNPSTDGVARTAGVNATWTLFEGFAAPLQQKRLRLQRDQARASENLSREDLLRGAALAYADLARQMHLRSVRDTVLGISEERLSVLTRRLASGSAARPDWLNGQVDRNADRAALIEQEAILYAARLSLAQALGRDSAVAENPSDSAMPSGFLELGPLLGNADDRQPAIRLAEADRDLARVSLYQAASVWYPRLDAVAGYNFDRSTSDGTTPTSVTDSRSIGPTVGLQVTLNLFDGEFPWRVAQRQRTAVNAADLRLSEAKFAVHAEVERAYSAWRAADSASSLEREGLGYARENLQLTFLRWKSGSLSYLEARTAQENYLDAFTRAENAVYDAFSARLDLLSAAGRMELLPEEAAASGR